MSFSHLHARGRLRARRGADGFTLIELLVVIVILGILAGVVVFAVRGAGDKGSSSAAAIDARTIKTAQGVFCAKNGRYATSEDELVDFEPGDGEPHTRFLRRPSTLHDIRVNDPDGEGVECGGVRYYLQCTADSGCPPPVIPPCPQTAGAFCLTARPGPYAVGSSPSNNEQMVELGDGKVLAISGEIISSSGQRGFMRFDPATETWSPAAKLVRRNFSGSVFSNESNACCSGLHTMVAIKGTPAECGDRCGQVLAHFGGGGFVGYWALYDSASNSWTQTGAGQALYRGAFAEAEQLTGPGCAPDCGKVLIVGRGGERDPALTGSLAGTGHCGTWNNCRTPPTAELYDPVTNAFAPVPNNHVDVPFPNSSSPVPTLTRLADGKMLLIEGGTKSQIYDPATKTFSNAGDLPRFHRGNQDESALLSDGDVLVTSNAVQSGTPTPMAQRFDRDTGTWSLTDGCGTTTNQCSLLAALPDGRVLAAKGLGVPNNDGFAYKEAYIFDAATGWSPTGLRHSLVSTSSANGYTGKGVLLTGPGCGTNCNKVLIAGYKAELYTPPAP